MEKNISYRRYNPVLVTEKLVELLFKKGYLVALEDWQYSTSLSKHAIAASIHHPSWVKFYDPVGKVFGEIHAENGYTNKFILGMGRNEDIKKVYPKLHIYSFVMGKALFSKSSPYISDEDAMKVAKSQLEAFEASEAEQVPSNPFLKASFLTPDEFEGRKAQHIASCKKQQEFIDLRTEKWEARGRVPFSTEELDALFESFNKEEVAS